MADYFLPGFGQIYDDTTHFIPGDGASYGGAPPEPLVPDDAVSSTTADQPTCGEIAGLHRMFLIFDN